jgi:hypothetical protein
MIGPFAPARRVKTDACSARWRRRVVDPRDIISGDVVIINRWQT